MLYSVASMVSLRVRIRNSSVLRHPLTAWSRSNLTPSNMRPVTGTLRQWISRNAQWRTRAITSPWARSMASPMGSTWRRTVQNVR